MTIELAQKSLNKNFGFKTFRPMQRDIVDAILKKRDCLVLMPTGGGKSLCYQLPATLMTGLTVVVSPLIALMKDQVEGLIENGIPAAYLNSSLSAEEQRDVEIAVKNGEIKLLYVSPEKLVSSNFQYFLRSISVQLFAIDEAHCISAWGHDFRPEYTQLSKLKHEFPNIPVVALTATADAITRRDIQFQLSLATPQVFVSSFDRPNIHLSVLPAKNRLKNILDFIQKRPNKSGIIYCLSRKQTERVAIFLQEHNISAQFYHAGMFAHERNQAQENFVHGRVDIMVATIAFGMGIDKSNVRFVIHHNLPKNIEGYYQEIGRAGRDGVESEALLFYSLADVLLLKKFASESGQSELQLAKLDRMQQFADAWFCRRRMLLAYFGEHLEENCDNCDVCENPPELFDATAIAQKALSAIARLNQQVPIRMLIDVLRGSKRVDLLHKGYNTIPTYGIGADLSFDDWQQYLLQMLNIGLIDIAYDKNHAVIITPAGRAVLLGNKTVQLVTLESVAERAEQQLQAVTKKSLKKEIEEELFDQLRELRHQIARRQRIAPYLVFTDATLIEMVENKPMNEQQMRKITGVGEKKFKNYGKEFLQKIAQFIREKDQNGKKVQGTTQQITFSYYQEGLSVVEIAKKRGVKEQTIYGHLADLYEQGYGINIFGFMGKKDLKSMLDSFEQKGVPQKLKSLYVRFKGKYTYHQIRFALAQRKKDLRERGIIEV